MIEMTEREKFLFDLQGFLHVEGLLTADEVKAMNDAVDANAEDENAEGYFTKSKHYGGGMEGEYNARDVAGMLTWEKPYCLPFRELIAHPRVIPYLNTLFGRGWRMDELPFIRIARKGTGGHGLHGATNVEYDGGQMYRYTNGDIRTGMAVFQFQLADINPGDGGITVVPGSHKANFHCPDDILLYNSDQQAVRNVGGKAGDMVIFLEATIHGALPWTADNHRRSLFYRYVPKYVDFHAAYVESKLPDWVDELTEVQKAVVQPPYVYQRPLLEDDGVTLVYPQEEPDPPNRPPKMAPRS
jgi:ectoine hydroxylase-related dioxygenase (phytanoyl-CoA dioxygenase family)